MGAAFMDKERTHRLPDVHVHIVERVLELGAVDEARPVFVHVLEGLVYRVVLEKQPLAHD